MGKLLLSLRLFAFFLLLGTVSCVEYVENQVQIYNNNFSKLDLANFENGRLLYQPAMVSFLQINTRPFSKLARSKFEKLLL